jgi:hypothetical protein
LLLKDGVLQFEGQDNKWWIVYPSKVVELVLLFLHDSCLAGQRDFEKTYDSIKARYFWLKMRKDVKDYCDSCHLCQTKKYVNRSLHAPLQPIRVKSPWSIIGIDVTGPLYAKTNGNPNVIVAVDYFTKYCIAKAVPNFTAETTAKFLFEKAYNDKCIYKLKATKCYI